MSAIVRGRIRARTRKWDVNRAGPTLVKDARRTLAQPRKAWECLAPTNCLPIDKYGFLNNKEILNFCF